MNPRFNIRPQVKARLLRSGIPEDKADELLDFAEERGRALRVEPKRARTISRRRVIRYLRYHEPDSGSLHKSTKIRLPKPWKLAR